MHRRVIAVFAALGALTAIPALAEDLAIRIVDVHSRKLHVEITGHGPPIVFLHGGLSFFDGTFKAQPAFFATSRTVIGIDQVGHGHSPDDDQPFSYQRMADDTASVIEQLGVGAVDVVGASDGGNVGLILAHDHPTLVRRLVISGANLTAGLSAEELEARSHWSDAQVAERLETFEARLPPRFKTDYQAVAPDGAAHWSVLLTKSYRLWLTPVIITPEALKTIAIPVLVIAGDHDFASIEDTTAIFRGLPHGQLLIVPGTGHGTFEDRPAFVNFAVREFLDALPAR